MHCEPKGQSPTPHKDRYIPKYENQNMACNASFCPESIKQSKNSGENQLSRQCGEEKPIQDGSLLTYNISFLK